MKKNQPESKISSAGITLTKLLEIRGLSLGNVAQALGIPQTTLHNMTSGVVKQPKLDIIEQLARFFQVPIELFLKKDLLKENEATFEAIIKGPLFFKDAIFTASIPLLQWEEIKLWFNNPKSILKETESERVPVHIKLANRKAFAITTPRSLRFCFPQNSLLIVERKASYQEGDQVLVSIDKKKICVRCLVEDNNQLYLRSPIGRLPPPLDKVSYKTVIYGHIIEYRVPC